MTLTGRGHWWSRSRLHRAPPGEVVKVAAIGAYWVNCSTSTIRRLSSPTSTAMSRPPEETPVKADDPVGAGVVHHIEDERSHTCALDVDVGLAADVGDLG